MNRRPTLPEAGDARRLAAPDMRIGRPRRLGFAAASLALHAGAAAAVAAALAWRAAPVAPPPESPVQVVWLDARPPAEPDAPAPMRVSRSPREAAPPAAPMGEEVAEGLEPEDMLATMLPDPDPVAPPPENRPATAEAPPLPLSELLAAAGLLAPEPATAPLEGDAAAPPPRPQAAETTAALEDRSAALAALALPPPMPPSRAPPSAAPPSPARPSQPQRSRAPDAAAAPARRPPSPGPPLARPEAAALAPPPAPAQVPLLQGPPHFRRPPSPPDYPAQARDRGEEGAVGLRLLVGADGTTREVRLHRSSGNRLLDDAALAAARRWEVEPASLDGRRVEAWVEVPVRFRLDR